MNTDLTLKIIGSVIAILAFIISTWTLLRKWYLEKRKNPIISVKILEHNVYPITELYCEKETNYETVIISKIGFWINISITNTSNEVYFLDNIYAFEDFNKENLVTNDPTKNLTIMNENIVFDTHIPFAIEIPSKKIVQFNLLCSTNINKDFGIFLAKLLKVKTNNEFFRSADRGFKKEMDSQKSQILKRYGIEFTSLNINLKVGTTRVNKDGTAKLFDDSHGRIPNVGLNSDVNLECDSQKHFNELTKRNTSKYYLNFSFINRPTKEYYFETKNEFWFYNKELFGRFIKTKRRPNKSIANSGA